MTDIVDITETYFRMPGCDFDSGKRYFRKKASGNPYYVMSGITVERASTGGINNGYPWLGFRYGSPFLNVAFLSTTVSGTTATTTVTVPTPTAHQVTI